MSAELQRSQPRSMFSTWVGIVLLFALFGLVALVVIGASPRGNTYEQKRAEERAKKLQAAQETYAQALTTHAWIDKTKGVVRIPIDEAMKLTVAELSSKKPAPGNPITAPETSPSAGAPPAPSAPAPAANTSGTPKPTAVTGPDSEGRNQPAAAANPPPAPPGTQPGASTTPAAAPPSAAVNPPAPPSSSPAASAPSTPLPVRGKTP